MLESFKGFATANFGWIVEKYPELFLVVKENLPKADIKMTCKTYVSISAFISSVSFIFSLSLTFLALLIIGNGLLESFLYSLITSLFISFGTFLVLVFYPLQKANQRKKSIETNLPFLLTHMGAIAKSGIPPYVTFRLISRFKEYGEASKEMEKIVRNIDSFGLDPLTAVKEVAEKTPSDSLRQVLLGFVTTTEAGGNVRNFLKSAGEQALFEWRMKREKFIRQLDTVSEIYTGVVVVAPFFIISLFSIMNLLQPTIAGYSIFEVMQLSIYLIIPLLNVIFMIFLRGIEVQI